MERITRYQIGRISDIPAGVIGRMKAVLDTTNLPALVWKLGNGTKIMVERILNEDIVRVWAKPVVAVTEDQDLYISDYNTIYLFNNDTQAWIATNILSTPGISNVLFIGICKGKLYMIAVDGSSHCGFYIEDNGNWNLIRDFGLGITPLSMVVRNGIIYISYNEAYSAPPAYPNQRGWILSYNGSAWTTLLEASFDCFWPSIGFYKGKLYSYGISSVITGYIYGFPIVVQKTVVLRYSNSTWIDTGFPTDESWGIPTIGWITYKNKLYIGSYNKCFAYDGSSWVDTGMMQISTITGVALYNNNIYVAGYIDTYTFPEETHQYILKYDGASWTTAYYSVDVYAGKSSYGPLILHGDKLWTGIMDSFLIHNGIYSFDGTLLSLSLPSEYQYIFIISIASQASLGGF